MAKSRTYSRYTIKTMSLLGKLIKLGRKERSWSESDLAERSNIARATLQKIEKGDPTVALGLVFEVAALVGLKLFNSEDESAVNFQRERIEDKLILLPKKTHKAKKVVDDDF